MKRTSRALVALSILTLGACGGGSEFPATSSRSEARQYAASTVSNADAAEQLLDFAEQSYPAWFVGAPATQSFREFRFRYYPQTGAYLGVVISPSALYQLGGVYVMGGPFAASPVYVGQLTAFITPVNAQIETAPQLAANFVNTLPHSPRGAGSPCADRAAWSGAASRAGFLVQQADALLTQQFPAWDQDAYIASAQSGNSNSGETMITARKRWLYPLVIAECATWTGKYLARIDEVMTQLATQPTWTSPIADRELVALNGDYFQDLWSAAIAQEVAQTLYMLGDRLSAPTRTLVLEALRSRSFEPARRAVNEGRYNWWLTTSINWNAVLVGGTVGAAMAALPSRYERAWFASLGQFYIDNYMAGFPASGYSTEGPSYWTYGMTYFAALRQRLYQASAGAVDLFASAKAQAASLFATRLNMTPEGSVAAFGDAFAPTYMDYPVRHLLAAAYGSAESGWPAAAQLSNFQNGNDSPITEAASVLSEQVSLVTSFASSEFTWPGLRSYFADTGVLVSRAPLTEAQSFAGTVKSAGSINHSHDDIGSYEVAMGTDLLAGDVGRGAYTSRTFSSERRTVKWINSYGHPVPVVGGRLQLDATNAPNRAVSTSFLDAADEILINMAPAYALPTGATLTRKFRNDRQVRTISIQDDFTLPAADTFEVPITTLGTWTQPAANQLLIHRGSNTVLALIEASGPFNIAPEVVTDDGLTFQRLAVRLNASALTGWIRISYSRAQ